jgi:hypothetical protein
VQKHHEQISWTIKSTRCYMYGEIGARSAGPGPGLVIIWCSGNREHERYLRR